MANRKPSWPLWITVILIVVPVLYVTSFGPVCWMADRGMIPDGIPPKIYRPLAFVAVRCCPNSILLSLIEYGAWGSGDAGGYPIARMFIGYEQMRYFNPDLPDLYP